jgi:hypothetical protein
MLPEPRDSPADGQTFMYCQQTEQYGTMIIYTCHKSHSQTITQYAHNQSIKNKSKQYQRIIQKKHLP